jgi:Zn-dependent peptidase ImmA (M78 family)/transcriptional regulator with XRE-family HTH domain
MVRVEIKAGLLRWARERAGLELEDLLRPFPKLDEWERGEVRPTLKQVESFARRTRVPVGYLFLPEPPQEQIPIPDFRTMGDRRFDRPSPDLLETIYICQERQEWFRDHARRTGEDPLPFVGSVTLQDDVPEVAARMRDALDFDLDERAELTRWTDALRRFVEQADEIGILVMASGIVLNNTHRKLDPEEFRGFALVDEHAPVVFVNGADTRAAQMFTLAHELAHVWLGESALSDAQAAFVSEHATERWCNQVAAEFLVPLAVLREEFNADATLHDEMNRLARRFKVSTLVILRRIHDAGYLGRQAMWAAYQAELDRLLDIPRGGSGGNFYATEVTRVSERFARAVVTSTFEGQTLYQDAFRLFGISKLKTFEELGRRLGVSG